MMSDLDSNAMGASDKYKGKYLEITGKLSNIDAAGKYIDLMADGDFEIIGVPESSNSIHVKGRHHYFKRKMYRCRRSVGIFS